LAAAINDAERRLMDRFREAALAVQAQVRQVTDMEEAFRYAVAQTRRHGGRTLAVPGWDPESRLLFSKWCPESIGLLTSRLRQHARDIHTAFTCAELGIAETGTLLLNSTCEDIRLATTLAEIHVAVLPAGGLRPDLASVERHVSGRLEGPGYFAFITGPSRTADIERVLTIGAHGPRELHILCLGGGT